MWARNRFKGLKTQSFLQIINKTTKLNHTTRKKKSLNPKL